jgi:hypothetical protein
MLAVRIVQLGISHPDLHVDNTLFAIGGINQSSILRANSNAGSIGDGVAKEVRRNLLGASRLIRLLAQVAHGAV